MNTQSLEDLKKDRVGEKFTTKEGYVIQIINYVDSKNCDVMFLETGHVVYEKYYREIVSGSIKNVYHKSVKGVAFFGEGVFSAKEHRFIYKNWVNMIERCFSQKYKNKNPTYRDCYLCEEWHNFQNFAKWFEENFNPTTMQRWHLDKDILVKGNKVYSPETCCFVPREINNLLHDGKSNKKSNLPVGVRKEGNRYSVRMNFDGKNKRIGVFDTAVKAGIAYQSAKSSYIKNVSEKWGNKISDKTRLALIELAKTKIQ